MASLIILLMTLGMLLYFFQRIWTSRDFLSKYIATVGGNKSAVIHLKPVFVVPFITVHSLLAIFIGYSIYIREKEGKIIFRFVLSSIVALAFLLLLFALYFIIIVIIKEIIYMKDRTINLILVYSIISSSILLEQIIAKHIEYPKGFLWISAVLYVVNIFGIGRIIYSIFKKKVLVKSIWSIAFMNISFVIIALSNFAYEIQYVYPKPCYSRILTSWGDALYFIVISFFTVGYGDLYPICEVTKLLSMTIILSGFTFTAVFVSAALSTTLEHFDNSDKKLR